MTHFILDFDRTLFDVDALYQALDTAGLRHLAGSSESVAHCAMHEFLFPDVEPFFVTKEPAQLRILSSVVGLSQSWEVDYQVAKIAASGLSKRVAEVRVVAGEKGPVVREWCTQQGVSNSPIVFIDDRIEHCLSVQECAPTAQPILLVRNPSVVGPVSRVHGIPVVHTLAAVDDVVRGECG